MIDTDFLSGGAAQPEPDFATVIASRFDAEPATTPEPDGDPVDQEPGDGAEPGGGDADPSTTATTTATDDSGEWWKSLTKEEVANLRNNKAGRSFDAIKKENKAAKAELERLQSELAKFKDVNLDEITSLKTKYEAQEAKIAAVRLEETDRYKLEILNPLAKVVQELDKLGGDELIAILHEVDPKERDAKLSAFLDTAPSYTAKKVERFFSDFEELAEKQATMRANAVDELKRAQEEEGRRTSEMTAKQRATYEGEVDRVFDILAKHELPADLLGEKVRGEVKAQDVAKMNPITQAFAVASAELLPSMTKLLKTREKEIQTLKDTVKRLQGASPGPGSRPGSALPADNLSFAEAIARSRERR